MKVLGVLVLIVLAAVGGYILGVRSGPSAMGASYIRGEGPPERGDRDRPRTNPDPGRVTMESAFSGNMGVTEVFAPHLGHSAHGTDPGCNDAKCIDACVSGIPVGSVITAVKAYAKGSPGEPWRLAWPHPAGFYDVLPYTRWYPGPTTTNAATKTKVCWQLRNWDWTGDRWGRLEVYFNPPH